MTTLEYSLSIPWNWISAHFQQIFNPSLPMPLSRRNKVSIPGCKAIMKVCHMFEYVLHRLTLPDQTRGSNQSCSSAGLQKTYRIHDRIGCIHPNTTIHFQVQAMEMCIRELIARPISAQLVPSDSTAYTVKSIVLQFSQSSYHWVSELICLSHSGHITLDN